MRETKAGWFRDYFDVNRVLALGFLLWTLATAATGLVHRLALILLMRLILGVGESDTFLCHSKIFAQHLSEQPRGFANGVIIATMSLDPPRARWARPRAASPQCSGRRD
jgi:MFS family permease